MTGREKILEAAKRVIMRKGIEGTSVREIAKEAELTTGAIYHHFKNKEEILYEVLDTEFSVTRQITKMLEEREITPKELLNSICSQIDKRIYSMLEHRLRFHLSYEATLGNMEVRKKLSDGYKHWTDTTASLFAPAFDIEANEKARGAAIIMIAALEGIANMQVMEVLPFDNHEIAEIYKDFFSCCIPKYLQKEK